MSWHELAWNKQCGLISFHRSGKLLDNMLINSLVMIIISAAAWACLFPDDALAVLSNAKRQLRQRVVNRHGEADARTLEHRMLDYAAKRGIDPDLVEEVLAEQHDWLDERLGNKAADEILGEADPSEGCS